MLTLIILNVFQVILSWLFKILPSIETTPLWIESLRSAVAMFKGFMEVFPFFNAVWICFLWIIAFEVGLITIRLFFGHRNPIN